MFAAATAAAARGQLSGHYLDLIVSCCCCDDRSGDGGEVYDNGTLVVTSGSCHRCECCYQCFVCCGSKLFFKFDFHHLFKTRISSLTGVVAVVVGLLPPLLILPSPLLECHLPSKIC